MRTNEPSKTFRVENGKLVPVPTAQTTPATAKPPHTQSPKKTEPSSTDLLNSQPPKFDHSTGLEQTIHKTLTDYRNYFGENYRAALARTIAERVRDLGELQSGSSIAEVVQRSIDWSGNTVPQSEIPTITNAVTTAIQNALKQ